MVNSVSRGISQKGLWKGCDLCGNKADPEGLEIWDYGHNLDGWFPGLSKLEVPSGSGTSTHQRSRVAARAVSLRGSPMENDLQQSRSVHIFDSLVCAKVVARGRSSSLF